jgi:hypothetical protein
LSTPEILLSRKILKVFFDPVNPQAIALGEGQTLAGFTNSKA